MSQKSMLGQLAARRKLGFLKTFDRKVEGLRGEADRLRRAASEQTTSSGRRSIDNLDRIIRGLVGAGPIYGIESVTAWSKKSLTRIDTIRLSKEPPTEDDFAWLVSTIKELEELKNEALEEAEQTINEDKVPQSREPKISTPPPVPDRSHPKSLPPTKRVKKNPRGDFVTQSEKTAKEEIAPFRDSLLPSVAPPEEQPVSVLVIAANKSARSQIAMALTRAHFQVEEVSSPTSAASLAQEKSPELIVIDTDDPDPGGTCFVEALSRNPLTDFIPLLKLSSSDKTQDINVLSKPIDTKELVSLSRRLSGREFQPTATVGGLSDITVEELTAFVNAEIRAGVMDAATGPHGSESFPVIQKGSIISAVWGLIARMRRVAAEGSEGKIRFLPTDHGPIGMMALDEAEGVLDPESNAVVDETDLNSLAGLSAVIADDDPEILTLFEKVLTDAGMRVRKAQDGKQALTAIQENVPDIIITDILMPEMDGWELATRLKYDYALKHIPVILISWKEDFLQRVRELNVEASDFMLKEIDRQQILKRVAGVLKPRFTLEQRLMDETEVTGRIERMGVLTILKVAMTLKPNCRVTIRENWNYFEIVFSSSEIVSVNRTGTDGSFASGLPALKRLLGVSGGRFSVAKTEETPRRQFRDGTWTAIRSSASKLNALNAQVLEGALVNIANIQLNKEVVDVYTKVIPPKLKPSLERLAKGESPRELVLSASASPEALEMLLLDLIRMGAVEGITGSLTKEKKTQDTEKSNPSDVFNAMEPPVLKAPVTQPSNQPNHSVKIESNIQRGSTNTMPIGLEDVSEIKALSSGKSEAPPLLANAERPKMKSSMGMKILGLLIVAVLVLVAYLSGREGAKEQASKKVAIQEPQTQARETAQKQPPATPSSEKAYDFTREEDTSDKPPKAPSIKKPTPPPPAQKAKPKKTLVEPSPTPRPAKVKAPQPQPKMASETKPKPAKPAKAKAPPAKKQAKETKPKPAKPAKAKAPPAKKQAPALQPGSTGMLSITVPPDTKEPISITIDKRPRGKAPLKVALTQGIHEIQFSSGGKRIMRMVSIKTGKTKSITAKVPQ